MFKVKQTSATVGGEYRTIGTIIPDTPLTKLKTSNHLALVQALLRQVTKRFAPGPRVGNARQTSKGVGYL